MPFTSNGPNLPPCCALCGCDESEHGIDTDICTGCGEECRFEQAEDYDEGDEDEEEPAKLED